MKVPLIVTMKNCVPASIQRNQCGSRQGVTVGAYVMFMVGAIEGAIEGAKVEAMVVDELNLSPSSPSTDRLLALWRRKFY